MKKYLLSFAVFGIGALLPFQNANAILLKASNSEFANVGLKLAIWAQNNGKLTTNDQNSTNFSIENARIYFAGQINPIVQFGANLDFADNNATGANGSARTHQGTANNTIVRDAFINFKFMPQAQLLAGLFVDPWSRMALTDIYSFVVPLYDYNPVVGEVTTGITSLLKPTNGNNKPFINPTFPLTLGQDVFNPYRDAGITLWGDIGKNTMLKYYLTAANGKYDYEAGQNGNSNLKYGFRIEFTPTMLGYKGTPGYVDEDTFLGSQNTLTFGIAYQQQKIECGTDALTGATNWCPPAFNGYTGSTSTTAKAWTIDMLWEQKFGDWVPNFQAAYLDTKDLGYAKSGSSVAQPESKGYYAQTQILYDRMVGIGKPALVLRYEEDENKNYYYIGNSFVDAKINAYDIFINYYIAGENANISFGAEVVNPNGDLKAATAGNGNQLKGFTDWTLALRTVF